MKPLLDSRTPSQAAQSRGCSQHVVAVRAAARMFAAALLLMSALPTLADTCGPCYGGLDGTIVPCNDWQTISGDNYGDADRLFEFEATAGVTYVFSFCEEGGWSGYDSSLAVHESAGAACGALLACNDDWCGLSSRLEWTAPADGAQVLRVGGYWDSTGSFTLAYRAIGEICEGLSVTPREGIVAAGPIGGPFHPASRAYTLSNRSETALIYRVSKTQPWVLLDAGSGPIDGPVDGALEPGASATVTVLLGPAGGTLPPGSHADTVNFTNLTDGTGDTTRDVGLLVFDPASLSRTDLFVLGRDNSEDDRPMLFRMNRAGAVLWERPLPFRTLESHGAWLASRNLLEDSFYLVITGSNRVGGLARVQKYDGMGGLLWDLPLAPDLRWISADPVHGGAYVSDGRLGVYRLDGDGNVVWGPLNWGHTQVGTQTWPVAADAQTGGLFTGVWDAGAVLKIGAAGELVWTRSISEPARLDANPVDGGVYVGSGGYSHTTYRLDPDGNVAWTKTCFPSCYTYPRTVSPVDGSLIVVSGWPSLIARAAMDGTVAWSVQNDDYAGHLWCNISLAADTEQDYFYGSQDHLYLGIDKRALGDTSMIWRTDPGYYEVRWGYGPQYHLYTGTPPPTGLLVEPGTGLDARGLAGGPFIPDRRVYTLTNRSEFAIDYSVGKTQPWLRLDDGSGPSDGTLSGTLAPQASAAITVSIGPEASELAPGSYTDAVSFTNLTDGWGNTTRTVDLRVHRDLEYPTGLISYWSFDEGSGTTAQDDFGSNHGTIYGAARTTGLVGSALTFDGVDDCVEIPDSDDLDITTQLTIEALVRPGVQYSGPYNRVISKPHHNCYPPYEMYGLFISQSDGLARGQVGSSGSVTWVDSQPLLPGMWSHLALTYDGDSLDIYVNGIRQGSVPLAGNLQTNDLPLYFGHTSWNGCSGERYAGEIDEVAIFNRALAQDEITEHYEKAVTGRGYFEPGNLRVRPRDGLVASGLAGGPFGPNAIGYELESRSEEPLAYAVSKTQPWVSLDDGSGPTDGPVTGALEPGGTATVTVLVDADANTLAPGSYTDTIRFTNLDDGGGDTTRSVSLRVFDPACLFVDDDNTTGVEDGTWSHPFDTIQEAVNAAAAGGRVCVLAGLYNETVEVATTGLTIEGADSASAVLDALGADAALVIHADEVTVLDLEIRNATRAGIRLEGVQRCRIASNRIHRIEAPYGSGSHGVALTGSSDNRIESNEIFDVVSSYDYRGTPWHMGGAVLLTASHRNEVRANRLHHVSSPSSFVAGVVAHESADWVVAANEIHHTNTSGSPYSGSNSTGILAYGGANGRILDNRIHDIHSDTHYAHGITIGDGHENLLVAGNVVQDVVAPWGVVGIFVWGTGSGNVVENNNVSGVSQGDAKGIFMSSSGGTVRGNRVHACGIGILTSSGYGSSGANLIQENDVFDTATGIQIDSSRDTIVGNTVRQNGTGVWLGSSSAAENRIFHNNFLNNGTQIVDWSGAANHWFDPALLEGNYWSDYPGADDGSGAGKHAIAGDGIGDTSIPWPGPGYDEYPFMEQDGWAGPRPIAACPPTQTWRNVQGGYGSGVLDGSGSYDPQGLPITCAWSSPTCTFSDPTSLSPVATCQECGNTVTLTVSNGVNTSTCTTSVLADGTAPFGTITAPTAGACMGAGGSRPSLRVEAFVDGVSQLVLRENTAQWYHMAWDAPGRWEGRNEPTIIGGAAWYPVWPDVPDSRNDDCYCNSSVYTGIQPALPTRDGTLSLRAVQARDTAFIAQYPTAANSYTTIIEFDDYYGGADWYIVDLNFEVEGGLVLIEDNFADNCPGELVRTYTPAGGPYYSEHGDQTVSLTVSDAAGNTASASVFFTVDLVPPEAQILTRLLNVALPRPGNAPFKIEFDTSDSDGASGGVVHEALKIDECLVFDGNTFGDGDGLLSDERVWLRWEDLCRLYQTCGLEELHRPVLRLEAKDCAGNVGADEHRLMATHVSLVAGICGPRRGGPPGPHTTAEGSGAGPTGGVQ